MKTAQSIEEQEERKTFETTMQAWQSFTNTLALSLESVVAGSGIKAWRRCSAVTVAARSDIAAE